MTQPPRGDGGFSGEWWDASGSEDVAERRTCLEMLPTEAAPNSSQVKIAAFVQNPGLHLEHKLALHQLTCHFATQLHRPR